MVYENGLINSIIQVLGAYTPVLAFVVGLIGGWGAFFWLAFLAAQGLLPIWVAFIFYALGLIIEDSFWFFIGRTNFARRKIRNGFFKKYKKAGSFLDKATLKNHFFTVLISKIFYATKHVTFIHMGSGKLKFNKFFFSIFISNLILGSFSGILGWFAGKGFQSFALIYKDLKLALIIVILLAVTFYAVNKFVRYLFVKNRY